MTIGQAKAKQCWFALCLTDVLFYNAIIRISQVYSLFSRLMLAASAQSP